VRQLHRARGVTPPATVGLTAAVDPRRRLSEGALVQASVGARLLGIPLLRLDATIVLICECGVERCLTPVEMTLSEYEAVRAGQGRWVVSSAHINELADSVIARRNGCALIHPARARPSGEAPTSGKEATSPPTAELSKR
jgi:hypothetical protein